MDAPKLIKPIPTQVVNERAAFGPVDLKPYFELPEDDEDLYFSASLQNGHGLPEGLIVTADGTLTGIPAKKTRGSYKVVLTAQGGAGEAEATFSLTIKEVATTKEDGAEYFDELKAQVWQALGDNLPVPELRDLLDRAVTVADVYYLFERWGTLTIYDAYNLEPPGEKIPLELEGMSEHFHIYDRGSCLVACPKDLFSHERTLEDGLRSARVMAAEAFNREWTMELVGFEKYSRAAWVELQLLGQELKREPEIINYNPTRQDIEIVSAELPARLRSGME
jgi:hypothetical protein